MELDFPNNPNVNDSIVFNGLTYVFNGTTWTIDSSKYTKLTYLNESATVISESVNMCDVSNGPITVTLPAVPLYGTQITVVDSNNSFGTNSVTVDGNGNQIEGANTFIVGNGAESTNFVFFGNDWKVFSAPYMRYQDTPIPVILGPSSSLEAQTIELEIRNYDATNTYNVSVTGGSFQRVASIVYWTLPYTEVTSEVASITVEVTDANGTSSVTKRVIIHNANLVGDDAIIVGNFSSGTYDENQWTDII